MGDPTEVNEPGSTVMIKESGVQGMVNCVALYAHGGILYEIVYWSNGERKTCWVNPQEIKANVTKKQVGFVG